ncbi:MAG: phosphatidate cytidylyltransferase [Bacteroidales bacterium]|nr:phosphatidate cytidylyltransferase [Bacteroidales bacterium]MCF8337020.1 phosphatidate cytidylyltransferase [Bacteroidales bacterium]
MNNFYQRAITGILYVAITVTAIIISPVITAILFLVIGLLTVSEFLINFKGRARPHLGFSLLISAMVYAIIALHTMEIFNDVYLLLLIAPVLAFFALELFRREKNPFLNITFALIAMVYVIVPLALLNNIYQFGFQTGSEPYQFLLAFFVLIWVNDTGAYLTGLLIGKHKLLPSVSPKKTWEGFFGGALLALVIAWLAGNYFENYQNISYVFYAIIIIIFATVGDLVESLLKRNFNVKDSGSILPGHGGMLDRFDGVLLSAPAIFLYMKLILES